MDESGGTYVIRVTNYFLLGIFGGGLAAWCLTLLLSTPRGVADHGFSKIPEKVDSLRRDFASGSPGDADGDGMSDTWELSYQLAPANPATTPGVISITMDSPLCRNFRWAQILWGSGKRNRSH